MKNYWVWACLLATVLWADPPILDENGIEGATFVTGKEDHTDESMELGEDMSIQAFLNIDSYFDELAVCEESASLGYFTASAGPALEPPRCNICYNNDEAIDKFDWANIVVVHHSFPIEKVNALKEKGIKVFGYVSMGAIFETTESEKEHYEYLKENNALKVGDDGKPVPNGNYGSYMIDPTKVFPEGHPKAGQSIWGVYLTETFVPSLSHFSGIFLDDLDLLFANGYHLTMLHYINTLSSNVDKLFGNRGLNWLNQTAGGLNLATVLDYILVESCVYLCGNANDPFRPANDYNWAKAVVDQAKKVNPSLVPIALDYIAASSGKLTEDQLSDIEKIRERHNALGWASAVGYQNLQSSCIAPPPEE